MAQSEMKPIQFPGLCEVLYAVKDVNIASLTAGSDAHLNLTITGVLLGDLVLFGSGVDPVDVVFSVVVTAADVVTVSAVNETAGTVDLADTPGNFIVLRPANLWALQTAD